MDILQTVKLKVEYIHRINVTLYMKQLVLFLFFCIYFAHDFCTGVSVWQFPQSL